MNAQRRDVWLRTDEGWGEERLTFDGTDAGGHAPDATVARVEPEWAADDLLPLVYDQLHAVAAQWFARQPHNHTLQPTAIVHEAYLRLAGRPGSQNGDEDAGRRWNDRAHFFRVAARAMRQVLIDYGRRRHAAKRGHAWHRVTLAEAAHDLAGATADLSVLNEALDRLGRFNERQCRIVELRFLAGLTVEETAEVLEISTRTVKLDWRMARAWLLGELQLEMRE